MHKLVQYVILPLPVETSSVCDIVTCTRLYKPVQYVILPLITFLERERFYCMFSLVRIVRRLRSPCRSKHRLVSVVLSLSAFLLMMIIFRQPAVSPDYDESQRDLWLQRVPMPDDLMNTDAEGNKQATLSFHLYTF